MYITILDYAGGEVYQIEWENPDISSETIEDFLVDRMEFRLSDIHWMIHDSKGLSPAWIREQMI